MQNFLLDNFDFSSDFYALDLLPRLAGCNWLELPLVVREQSFRRLVCYVLKLNLSIVLIDDKSSGF